MAGGPENSTDIRDRGTVTFVVDMRPSTLLDEMKDNGVRVMKPVGGEGPSGKLNTGGAHLVDTEAAKRLGVTGNNSGR